ncbi:MAG: thermonuclease family protein [Pirellulales bacterium]
MAEPCRELLSGKDMAGRLANSSLKFINTMMVRMGMAWWYSRYDKTEELENAERYAKEKKIGLWADKNPIAPWDWRKGKR